MPDQKQDTKERILDVAEQLFASKGFKGASLRAVTGKAGVNLAAVNYHFGSKEALLEAVLERRIGPLNKLRRARLEEVLSAAAGRGERPKAADIMRAFVEPTLRFRDTEPGAGHLIKLIGRSLADPDDTVRKSFQRIIGPFVLFLVECLKKALPEVPEPVLMRRIHFTMGAFAHTMCNVCETEAMPEQMRFPGKNDTELVVSELVAFVTAGLEGR